MPTPTSRVRSTWPWYLAMLLVAGLAAGIISAQFLAESLAALGIPDPGMLTTFGLPFFRAAAWILVALAVGSYLLTAFLIPPQIHNAQHRAHRCGDHALRHERRRIARPLPLPPPVAHSPELLPPGVRPAR